MLPSPSWHPSATRLGDDLTALLSVELPESISTPREDFWTSRGGLERWWQTGRANLRALLISDALQHQRLTPPSGEGAFDVVLGESFFTASTALLTDDLLRRFAPGTDSSRGDRRGPRRRPGCARRLTLSAAALPVVRGAPGVALR